VMLCMCTSGYISAMIIIRRLTQFLGNLRFNVPCSAYLSLLWIEFQEPIAENRLP